MSYKDCNFKRYADQINSYMLPRLGEVVEDEFGYEWFAVEYGGSDLTLGSAVTYDKDTGLWSGVGNGGVAVLVDADWKALVVTDNNASVSNVDKRGLRVGVIMYKPVNSANYDAGDFGPYKSEPVGVIKTGDKFMVQGTGKVTLSDVAANAAANTYLRAGAANDATFVTSGNTALVKGLVLHTAQGGTAGVNDSGFIRDSGAYID